MNVFKSIVLISGALILTAPLVAQRDQQMRRGQNLSHMSQELELSDEQKAKVKEIMKSSRKARKESQEASKAEVQAQIIEILSPEQRITFNELKVEHEEKKERRLEAQKAIEDFKEKNVKPFILQRRLELESKLSAEDKTTLNRIRADKPERMEKGNRKRRGKRSMPGRLSKENRESLKAITEKYAEDINKLQKEVAANQENWNKEIKAIRDAYKWEEENERGEERLRSRSPRKSKEDKRGERGNMKNIRFLLMEVD